MSDSQDEMQELIGDFVAESTEHLSTVEADLLSLEEGSGDDETVNNIFRCVHSVKGVASFLGLDTIQELAHTLESTLDLVRKQRLEPTGELTSVLLAAIDELKSLIDQAEHSNGTDVASHLEALRHCQGQATEAPTTVAAATADVVAAPAAPANEAQPAAGESPAEEAVTANKPASKSNTAQRTQKRGTESIRVGVDLLNRLMDLSGELVLGRNQVLRGIGREAERSLHDAAANLSHVVSEMQEAIMQTRLQAVSTLFQKFPRIVRDLAGKLGKQCRLMQEGGEVELDRSILEALADPMTHLVRNAMDHGVETPEHRRAGGKGAEGQVTLRAFHQGGNVRIEIEDDGAGIDPDKLRSRAIEKGLMSQDEADDLSDRDARMLIFAPGFSTAEQLSDISGRGVGMDVVRSNIEKLGGSVNIRSEVGEGTTLSITIPLTLAIMPALVVSCAGNRYVVPQSNVTELVRLRPNDPKHRIVMVDERRALRLRGRLLPVVDLSEALGLETSGDGGGCNVMLVQSGTCEYGLVINTPPDTEEIVVKPLGRHLRGREEFAGSTILGDGQVGLILDVTGISNVCDLRAAEAELTTAAASQDVGLVDSEADLAIFRAGGGELFALPLGIVARIQRATAADLDTVGDRLVYRSAEGIMPVVTLPATKRPANGSATLLVLRNGDRNYGTLAESVEEIRSEQVQVDDQTLRAPGVLGSIELPQGTVRLLDSAALSATAFPESGNQDAVHRETTRILLAEDSGFFRAHVARVLQEAGFVVTSCVDGDDAWQQLQADGASYDLVLTDVQMPNCDGLELTRRIRDHATLAGLPVLALTSLSTDEARREGEAAGVTEYLVKLDDRTLLAAIERNIGVRS